jgi:hypothetical protein
MKTVRIHAHCTVCGFTADYYIDTNEYGFFVMPQGFCPNDLLILDQEIRRDVEGEA